LTNYEPLAMVQRCQNVTLAPAPAPPAGSSAPQRISPRPRAPRSVRYGPGRPARLRLEAIERVTPGAGRPLRFVKVKQAR